MTREKDDAWERSGPDGSRSDRPLGRGLEEISHLFLSKGPNDAAPERVADNVADRLVQGSVRRPSTVLLRECASVGRERFAALLREAEGALEDGLRVLDRDLVCYPCGQIDLLALDRASQLVIVDFENTLDDGLLVRGLGHFDWIVRNVPALRRMYPGLAINFSLPPRLCLLAPQFSAVVACVARQIARPQIAWVRYHIVEIGASTGILFEPFAGGHASRAESEY